MHLYRNTKKRIGSDRPQGVNVPCTPRRLLRVVSGDTLAFTANIVCPATREPVKEKDLSYTAVYIAVAENRFTPVLWAGSLKERWITLDPYRPGLIHVTVPRTVMNVLRRGVYSFSIVVDDGIVRETQLTGNFQVEYEPTGSLRDIPYRNDMGVDDPICLTPEIDLAAQTHHRLTYQQLLDAVAAISRVMLVSFKLSPEGGSGSGCDCTPSYGEIEETVHRLSQIILWDDELRRNIPRFVGPPKYEPFYEEFVARVLYLAVRAGLGYPCVPGDRRLSADPKFDEVVDYVRWAWESGLIDRCSVPDPYLRPLPDDPTVDDIAAYVGGRTDKDYDALLERIRTLREQARGR